MFGRESQARKERVERYTAWIRQRDGYSLACLLFGIIAVVDSFTLVIGVLSGVIAIVLGIRVMRNQEMDDAISKRFGRIGITLGCIGICLALLMWTVIYPMIEHSASS